MTRDDILRMAREAGWAVHTYNAEIVERFFKLAYEAGATAEREKVAAWMRQKDEWARDRLARHGIPEPDDGNPSF